MDELRIAEHNLHSGGGSGGSSDGDRVSEWEDGLPEFTDLAPLYQHLIPPELASAFRITPEPSRTNLDLNRASNNTIINLNCDNNNNFNSFAGEVTEEESITNKNVKRQRLVWTAQLHKRFIDVVGHVGIKNAVPKTIMQMMNVEGLTRENVASHLQKYRLYLKRMHEGSSASDHLFESTVISQNLNGGGKSDAGNGNGNPVSLQYPMLPPPQMMHVPMVAMAGHGVGYHGYEAHYQRQFNMMPNNFGSGHQYHQHVPRNGE